MKFGFGVDIPGSKSQKGTESEFLLSQKPGKKRNHYLNAGKDTNHYLDLNARRNTLGRVRVNRTSNISG